MKMPLPAENRCKRTVQSYLKCIALNLRRCAIPTVNASETQPNVADEKVEDDDGWQRLKTMFSKDDNNETSPELSYVYHGTCLGGATGGIIGGFLGARHAVNDFISRNEATVFYNELDGKRRLNDHVMLTTMRSAFRWGWRLGFLSGLYLLTMTSLSVYRNRLGVLDYVAAGGITGAIYRINLGLKGMIAGGVVGTFLGCIYGGTAYGLTRLTGTQMEDLRTWQQAKAIEERRRKQEGILKKRERVLDPVLARHEKAVKTGVLNDEKSSSPQNKD